MNLTKLIKIPFIHNENEKKTSCNHCIYKFNGKNVSNLKRAIINKHPYHVDCNKQPAAKNIKK